MLVPPRTSCTSARPAFTTKPGGGGSTKVPRHARPATGVVPLDCRSKLRSCLGTRTDDPCDYPNLRPGNACPRAATFVQDVRSRHRRRTLALEFTSNDAASGGDVRVFVAVNFLILRHRSRRVQRLYVVSERFTGPSSQFYQEIANTNELTCATFSIRGGFGVLPKRQTDKRGWEPAIPTRDLVPKLQYPVTSKVCGVFCRGNVARFFRTDHAERRVERCPARRANDNSLTLAWFSSVRWFGDAVRGSLRANDVSGYRRRVLWRFPDTFIPKICKSSVMLLRAAGLGPSSAICTATLPPRNEGVRGIRKHS